VRLLVVEDEADLALAVARALTRDRHAVDVATTAREAVEALVATPYDLVLLDIALSDGDGLVLLDRIRAGEFTPGGTPHDPRVLMLTARGSLADRVRGLDGGADDYLVKPFELAELLARVRALLRRETAGTASTLQVSDLSIDLARHAATRAGAPLELTPKEFAVLAYLMSRPGVVVSSEQLLEHVWDAHADPFTETVRVTVGTLRRKLAAAGPGGPPIETVPRHGYRLLDGPSS
jgi:DNA-binding response OmpR family regulator